MYNKLRAKWHGIISVLGAYLVATGIAAIIGMIVTLGNDGSFRDIVPFLCLIVLGGVILFIAELKCKTTGQKILLPFACIGLAVTFIFRLILSLISHAPLNKPLSEKEPEPEVKEEVDVWRENGYMTEHLKVNSDNTMYYDPDDGEWHKIQK